MKAWTILLVFLLAGCRTSHPIRIAIGGQAQIGYLPTTLAEQLGYYRDEGLQVRLDDLSGGARALQALVGGSADVVSGFYDHTIQMAANGRELRAFVTILRYPGLVAAVSPATSRKIDRIEDLRGALVGVTAPGSSTHFFLNYLLAQHGLDANSVSVNGVGGSSAAVAAMVRGTVDAAIMTDPAFSEVARQNSGVRILADTRTGEGVRQIFGADSYPASVFYSTASWVDKNPDDARRLARVMIRTLHWLREHSPEEIIEKMPPAMRGGDRTAYVEALRNSMPMFSPDGRMSAEGAEAVRKALSLSMDQVRTAPIDLAKTYTNDFVD